MSSNMIKIAALCGKAATPLWAKKTWHTIWVANTGTQEVVDRYLPRWAQERYKYSDPTMMGGVFNAPGAGLSLVCGTILTNEELAENPKLLGLMVENVCKLKAKKISFAGVIPSLLHKHDLWPDDDRLIKEQEATRFMILENVREIAAKHLVKTVCVVGVGFTGAQVANDLAAEGYKVFARDPRPEVITRLKGGVEYIGMDTRKAATADVIVLLSTDGDGIRSLVPFLGANQVVLADTHPKMKPSTVRDLYLQGVWVYESALTYPGLTFMPKLPQWNRDTIPGCVGQAFVEASDTYDPRRSFEENARDVIKARLDIPEVTPGTSRPPGSVFLRPQEA